ncbi:hypothetical protein [Zobellia alginiliquefaciens]|uniref:hypothetical protein n=1 Tax=Zobellia alginiliquefaciens TaxID=3032586 RepID=UPI0023E44B40|nr:hypothetical protein [Zobellia alginiliquefaciens]
MMKFLKNINSRHITFGGAFLEINRVLLIAFLFVISIISCSCSDFVEVDPPKNNLISETVFKDPSTVESALANLYYGMREQGMVSGLTSSR